jgi:predicted phage tail protein
MLLILDPAIAQAIGAPLEFEAAVSTVAEAVAAIRANFPRWGAFASSYAAAGLSYRIQVGRDELAESQLRSPISPKVRTIRIELVPVGSGGVGRVIAGIALIGLGLFAGGIGFLGMSGATTALLGGALLIGALFGQQKSPKKGDDNRRSVGFSRPASTAGEGAALPVIYGVMLVGWIIVSANSRNYFV